MAHYELVDCCPVPVKLVPVMRQILGESGATLQSCYRADDAAALLHQCGKHSQAELYYGWTHHLPGYNPANPPGRSTHELRNDGIAYRVPAGAPLFYWQVGIDIDDAHVQSFIQAARNHGYIATITYPGSPREYHHVNFRKEPIFALPPLKRGDGPSPRVWKLKIDLSKLGYFHGDGGHSGFGLRLDEAVRAFQKAYHLTPDGVVGPATQAQIAAALRLKKAKAKGHR